MKKCVLFLLIGLMVLGLTLSVFAAEPSAPATSAPLAGDNPAALDFARKIIRGACALAMLYAQLGWGALGAGSGAKSARIALASSIRSCSAGMSRERFRQFPAGLPVSRKEQKEVCHG